ncbi:hypothetical protein [Paraburkholderia kirstenboschensis]|uniref:BON domain-containing protein n=1 Tax=Paraburkholderia kirstenboschensis TaxID=1245436 RepID=A0ABZ0ES81_9BURK|nr:hypothetical protein [Paraburkholderia kirstenboschensis]WOD19461.1 hypothetical protein RW095_24810 [Paraburkholderia kirstenboschensis]
MKIRIVTIACAATAAALLAACTAVYKNSDACEQLMRSKLAEKSSDTLKIGHTGAGIDGSRVVVEGSIEHVMTASEVAAASARAASGVRAGRGVAASGVRAASASSASAAWAASGASGSSASGASSVSSVSQAASSVTASEADALARKPTKPKKLILAAAAECTFRGPTLDTFSWLAPAKLAAPSDPDASEAEE